MGRLSCLKNFGRVSDGCEPENYRRVPIPFYESTDGFVAPRYSWPVRIALAASVVMIAFVVLVVALAGIFLWLHARDVQHMEEEWQVLTEIVADEPERFGQIQLHEHTPRYVMLVGVVQTEEDLQHLKKLVSENFKDEAEIGRCAQVHAASELLASPEPQQ